MTERELFEAIRAMIPNAYNVVGFYDLLEAERPEGERVHPIDRVRWEAYMVAGGYDLAIQVHRLARRLEAEGIQP